MKEDLAAFFPDFQTTVTQDNSATFQGIIEAPFVQVGEGAGVESSALSLICLTVDVADVGAGSILGIDDVEYTVRGVEPDGIGITTLRLEKV